MSPRSPFKSRFRSTVVLCLLGLGLATPVFAAEAPLFDQIARQLKELLERVRPAIVKIEGTDAHGRLSGTGFAVDPRGLIYTSYSVGGKSEALTVALDNRKYPARRLLGDSRSGIAILKIEAETPFLTLGDTGSVQVGDPVVAVGYPMDLPLSPSFGIVAGFDLKFLGRFFATTHIRASTPIQRGEGGAPLLDLKGNVVGILISSLDGGSGCFALPIEAAEKVRSDFMRFGSVNPGWLGIDVGEAPAPEAGSLARIKGMIEDSPAAQSNLEQGDTILKVGAVQVKTPADVLNASFFLTAGDTVPVVVARDGQTVEVLLRADVPRTDSAEKLLNLSTAPNSDQAGLRFETK